MTSRGGQIHFPTKLVPTGISHTVMDLTCPTFSIAFGDRG